MHVPAFTGDDVERQVRVRSHLDVPKKFSKRWVRTFKEGVIYVRSIQEHLGDWKPKQPKTVLAYSFFEGVARNLSRHDRRRLGLYNSVGTPLDRMGVDCFIQKGDIIVSIDLTVNPRKRSSGADLVLNREDFIRDEHLLIAGRVAEYLCR